MKDERASGALEYLTVAEAGEFLRLRQQSVRNKMTRGVFRRGVHYFKRQGEIGVRFKRSALVAWLEGTDQPGADEQQSEQQATVISMARGYRLGGSK